jgi:uncharacterized membrane protein
MNTNTILLVVWAVVTVALVALLTYRSRLTRQESDWIDLTNDEREERAIQTQTLIEKKAQKLTWPIRGLSALSAALLLLMLGVWLYQGISNQPVQQP